MADFDAADWNLRSPQFRQLREVDRSLVGMELAPELHEDERRVWTELRRAWQGMPTHPNAIDLIGVDGDRAILKFAAIDWRATASTCEVHPVANCLRLVDLFEHIVASVEPQAWVWFQCPQVFFDLRGEPRVVWLPVSPTNTWLAPEARSAWPHCSEKTLVYVLGRLMSDMGLGKLPKGALLERRCTTIESGKRLAKLRHVRIELRNQLRNDPPERSPSWELVEEGIGWLELDRPERARARFEAARELSPTSHLAAVGLSHAIKVTVVGLLDVEKARNLEDERRFDAAIAAYRAARHLMGQADYIVALARCAFAQGQHAYALELAQRASAIDPDRVEALQLIVKAALPLRFTTEAATACERLAAIAPAIAIEPLGEVIDLEIIAKRFVEASKHAGLLATLTARESPSTNRGVYLLGQLAGRIALSGKAIEAAAVIDKLHALSPEHGHEALLGLATCLATVKLDEPLAICERLYAAAPAVAIEGFANVIEGAFRRGEIAEALRVADRLIALAPNSPIAHYRRGRCLLGLRRLHEAREALEHAQTLDPKLVEAMHLRREVDRAIGTVRAHVGTPSPAPQLAIPDHLAEVRAAMARGSIDDAVAWLESQAIGDGSARLLLGRLLHGQNRFLDAVAAFDRVSGPLLHEALIGKAQALAEMGRREEALHLLDRVCAEQPELTEAVVIRARIIHTLRAEERASALRA